MPKCLWMHYFDPHAPYGPSGFDAEFSSRSGYNAENSFVEEQPQRLLAYLDSRHRHPISLANGGVHHFNTGQVKKA